MFPIPGERSNRGVDAPVALLRRSTQTAAESYLSIRPATMPRRLRRIELAERFRLVAADEHLVGHCQPHLQ